MSKYYPVAIGACFIIAYILLGGLFVELRKPAPTPVTERIVETREVTAYRSVTRGQINELVHELLTSGRGDAVYAFYDQYTEDREITYMLIRAAMLYELPINLVFGLLEWESGFDPEAVHTNGNGTGDIGLWMLHERTFPQLTREQMMDPGTSTRNGAWYLREQYERYGWWEAAIIAYNGGDIVDVKESTIVHQGQVLSNERRIDASFVEAFGSDG